MQPLTASAANRFVLSVISRPSRGAHYLYIQESCPCQPLCWCNTLPVFTAPGVPRLRAVGKPFRWNMARSRLMRRLGRGRTSIMPDHQQDRLLRCAAKVLRAGGGSDLVFVGRSLESVYDLLCGALSRTTWYDRVQLLQLSLRHHSPEGFQ